jgi:hypothetical protein
MIFACYSWDDYTWLHFNGSQMALIFGLNESHENTCTTEIRRGEYKSMKIYKIKSSFELSTVAVAAVVTTVNLY